MIDVTVDFQPIRVDIRGLFNAIDLEVQYHWYLNHLCTCPDQLNTESLWGLKLHLGIDAFFDYHFNWNINKDFGAVDEEEVQGVVRIETWFMLIACRENEDILGPFK